MTQDSYILLIARSLSGDINAEDQRALNEWLKESDANKDEFKRLKGLWDLSRKQKKKEETYDSSAAWDQFLVLKEKEQAEETSGNLNSKKYYMIAASLAMIVVSVFVLKELFVGKTPEAVATKVEAALPDKKAPNKEIAMMSMIAKDSIKQFILPDNSKVHLNKNSSLEYRENFEGGERITYLKGEAFFEITHLDSIPFIVSCNGIMTKVLGTSFGVRTGKENKIEVYVTSGKVEVYNEKKLNASIMIQRNEKVIYDPAAPFFSKEKMNGKEVAWKEKKRNKAFKRDLKIKIQ